MLKLIHNPDRNIQFALACSGGVDSMAAADFFYRGKKNFKLAYFHHNTPQADSMLELVLKWGRQHGIEVLCGNLTKQKPSNLSPEEFWRVERYKWFDTLNMPIVTCHHLNDVAETWIFSSLNGNPKIIAPKNGKVIRPFLLNSKQEMIDWCIRHNVSWFEDKSNKDVKYPRNRIRHNILPECLMVNPGLLKVMKKKIISSLENKSQ